MLNLFFLSINSFQAKYLTYSKIFVSFQKEICYTCERRMCNTFNRPRGWSLFSTYSKL